MDRFWIGFWIDFGEVFGEVLERFWKGFWRFLEIIVISVSYYSAYHVGTDLGRNLEVILIDFKRFLYSFLNDFRGHIGMILLLLFILFQYSFQMMRSLCQGECEADV